jgi:hypothetical protein
VSDCPQPGRTRLAVSLRLALGLTGALVALESTALLVGIFFVQGPNPWCSAENLTLVASDILVGAWLIRVATRRRLPRPSRLLAPSLVLAATHAYRDWAYLVDAPNAFCANTALFVFNNLRLAGLAIVMGMLAAAGRRRRRP